MSKTLKKIVIATGIYPPAPGGPATHAKRYREHFIARGVSVAVCTYGKRLKRGQSPFSDKKYGVISSPSVSSPATTSQNIFDQETLSDSASAPPGVVSVSLGLPFGVRQFVYSYRLWRISNEAQVILALDALGAGIPALLISRMRGVPLVLRVGGDVLWERATAGGRAMRPMNAWYAAGAYRSLSYYLVRMVVRTAWRVIVPTILLADVYYTYYGAETGRISVIPNPLPAAFAPDEAVARPRGRTIVYASRFVAYKNLTRLIRAFARAKERVPAARLVLFGQGPEEHRLRDEAALLRVGDAVEVVTDAPDDVRRDTMRTAALCVAPALTEFYPNYIMECLAFGVPFVISREHGLPFTVAADALFNPEDERDMARALVWGLEADPRTIMPDLSAVPYWDDYLAIMERAVVEAI